jgi:cyclopropane fatty-acyl-phospholipid synthase-like methyltransferase
LARRYSLLCLFPVAGGQPETAQMQKIDYESKLQVRPGDRLLDIGCGWAR